ncbi:hypothetical protein AHAS_Ahas07G0113700 [Arachis hypogaea]
MREFIGIWWLWLITTRRSTITIGLVCIMDYAHSIPEEVVAMKIVHMIEVPPTFDFSILDAYPHCNFYFLQHN